MIIEREPIISPLFSGIWILAGLFLFLNALAFDIKSGPGWLGIKTIAIPVIVLLYLSIRPVTLPFLVERLVFNKNSQLLKTTRSDGTSSHETLWPYQDICHVRYDSPLYRPTAVLVIATDEEEQNAIRIESIEPDAVEIFNTITAALPAQVRSFYRRSFEPR